MRARTIADVPVHEGAEELLAREDLEAVIICAPTRVHAELARAAARAGKHFLVEKPLATTLEDARSVAWEAARADVRAAVGFNRRFHPLYRQARAILARGTIGRVRTVVTAFCEPMATKPLPAWRETRASGGGVLLDLASHHLDLVRWFLDDEIVEVSATISSKAMEEDSARLRLFLRSGIEAIGAFSYWGGFADFLEFVGERGSLRVDRHRPNLELRKIRRRGYGIRRARVIPIPEVFAWRVTRMLRSVREPSYGRSLGAFVDLVRGRLPGSLATLSDGVRNIEIIVAAEASARQGGEVVPVAVPPRHNDLVGV
jgi:predicted dehydrogenase